MNQFTAVDTGVFKRQALEHILFRIAALGELCQPASGRRLDTGEVFCLLDPEHHGVAVELIDIDAADEDLDEVRTASPPSFGRVPPAVWWQLRQQSRPWTALSTGDH